MKSQLQSSLPWNMTGQNLAAEVSWEMRHQLTSLSALSQWALVPVILLTSSGLWHLLDTFVLLLWAALALIQTGVGFINSRINSIRLQQERATDHFLLRNTLYYSLSGLIWGSLPLLAALWGSERAFWFALIIAMAMLTAYVLVLSSSHRVFFGALGTSSTLVITSLVFTPAFSMELLLLGLLYLLALLLMHNTLFQVHVDRVRSSLRSAAHASALANSFEHFDALTGLYNKTGLKQWLKRLSGLEGNYRNVSLILANVKGFSEINVLHGSSVADILLIEIATRLVQMSGEKFGLARLGGAEFLLVDIRAGTDTEDMAQILAQLEHEDYLIAGRQVNISFQQNSVQGSAEEIDFLIETARSGLQSPGIEARVTPKEQKDDLQYRRDLVMSFHDALQNDQISPWFQPIVDCSSNNIIGWEALVRWQHPVHGIILPEDFLDIARISGQSTQLTRRMFIASAAFASHLVQLGNTRASRVSINFTASDLTSNDTMIWVMQTMEQYGLKPGQLSVEISEKEALIQHAGFSSNLQRMKEAGIPLAIDDFGTGYANISQLLDLPASTLKLDKRFVEKLPHDKHSVALVRAIIAMARSMSMLTVAEGVERPEQLNFLRDYGCDAYQGFLAGIALPVDDATAFIDSWSLGQPR